MRILGWLVFVFLVMPLYANEKVESIIGAMGVQKELEAVLGEFKPYQQDFSQGVEDEVTLLSKRHQEEDLALFEKYFSWENLQPELVLSFETTYTPEEISAIYKFVKSKHGREYFAKLGDLADKNQALFAGIFQEYESERKPLSDRQSKEFEQLAKKLEAEEEPLPELKVYPDAPLSFGDVVRFMVATSNGKMIGYKVRLGRQEALFDQAGLKPDDIVVSVNGIEVNEPQKVREVYLALKETRQIVLEVMRNGGYENLVLDLDELEEFLAK